MEEPIFKNLKVLELAAVLAGPGVGQFFAELGAEVIKVENLRTAGDVTRTWRGEGEQTDDRSAYFCSVNWGKMSIALDLSTEEGQSIVHQLAIVSDVVIASFKPGDAAKLRVDYPALSESNPRLIYGSITGYGPENERVGYDAVIQAETGFMDLNGERNAEPLKMPVALMDVLAGHHLKQALLLSIIKRERTGKGEYVEVSLLQSAVASLVNQASNWLVANKLPVRIGSSHPNIAPYGDIFTTADGRRLLLAVGSDTQFVSLCSVLNISHLSSDQRFLTNSSRVANRRALNGYLKKEVADWDCEVLNRLLQIVHVPSGIVQNIKELMEMPEARAMLVWADGLTGVSGFAGGGKVSHLAAPPHLGEHSDVILERLGVSKEDAMRWRRSGILL